MKKLTNVLIIIIMLTVLCGCSNAITEGEVYEKQHREAHSQLVMMPIVITNGKTTTTTIIPYYISYPDRYVVFIKAFRDGEWVTEDFYVSKDVYDTVNIGDMFVFDEDRGDMKDEPYTKERKEE